MAVKYLEGSSENDKLVGFKNFINRIDGQEGHDTIYGGTLNDVLHGGNGNDYLRGLGGDDILRGGNGDDILRGGEGNDMLEGNSGNDIILGEEGSDSLYGNEGNDHLLGGTGNDILEGGAGNDRVYGQDGNDNIWGGDGNDELRGDAGNDTLYGEAGNDTLLGGAGNDTLVYKYGYDTLVGGAGNDLFVYLKTTGYGVNAGHITDFTAGEDKIDFRQTNIYGIGTGYHGVKILHTGDTDYVIHNHEVILEVDVHNGHRLDVDDLMFATKPYSGIEILSTDSTITGTAQDDVLLGISDLYHNGLRKVYDQTINGGAGNDTLQGGNGSDTLIGGLGHDVFIFSPIYEVQDWSVAPNFRYTKDTGFQYHDVIKDFNVHDDKLEIHWLMDKGTHNVQNDTYLLVAREFTIADAKTMLSTATDTDKGVVLHMAGWDHSDITLVGVHKAQLTLGIFTFSNNFPTDLD